MWLWYRSNDNHKHELLERTKQEWTLIDDYVSVATTPPTTSFLITMKTFLNTRTTLVTISETLCDIKSIAISIVVLACSDSILLLCYNSSRRYVHSRDSLTQCKFTILWLLQLLQTQHNISMITYNGANLWDAERKQTTLNVWFCSHCGLIVGPESNITKKLREQLYVKYIH